MKKIIRNKTFCEVCKIKNNKDFETGILLEGTNPLSTFAVHHYCLLLSTDLPQLAKDSSQYLGFQKKDIQNLILETEDTICHYCGNGHATIKCHRCEIRFHLTCGLQQDCLNTFSGDFKSFCHHHHGIKHVEKHDPQRSCHICFEKMGVYNPIRSITCSGCPESKNTEYKAGWVHRDCLKMYALSAGYYLNCIWCHSVKFRDVIRQLGIFVPDREAYWEMETNAFAGLRSGYKRCDAENCTRNSKSVIVCTTCGAYGIHTRCYTGSLPLVKETFMCPSCTEVFKLTVSQSVNLDMSVNENLCRSLYVTKFSVSVVMPKESNKEERKRHQTSDISGKIELIADLTTGQVVAARNQHGLFDIRPSTRQFTGVNTLLHNVVRNFFGDNWREKCKMSENK